MAVAKTISWITGTILGLGPLWSNAAWSLADYAVVTAGSFVEISTQCTVNGLPTQSLEVRRKISGSLKADQIQSDGGFEEQKILSPVEREFRLQIDQVLC